MRKATVAPRVAPWRDRPIAVGTTPHEQSGRGVPMAEAHRTERILPRPRNRLSSGRRHEDGEEAGENEPQQHEEGGLHQDGPRLGGHPEQELRHARPRRWRRRLEAGRPAGPGVANGLMRVTLYFGKYFLSSAQATEYCGSTTLAILMTAVWPRSS